MAKAGCRSSASHDIIIIIISTFFFIYFYFYFIFPCLFSVVAAVVVTVSLTFEENPPISFQLLDDPR